MTSPFTGGEVILIKEPREHDFRGSKFHIIHHYYQCMDTEETFTDTRLDELNLNQVYNQYREKEGIPFSDEITEYRRQYDMPATKMSQILGFGVNMYGRYESGEIPNVSNGRMINICKDPDIFKTYFLQSTSHQFTEKEKESFLKKIDKAIEHKKAESKEEFEIYAALGNTKRGIYTGFITPNLKKAREMVVYFAQACSPFTTKMNKLLFYADFLNFKRTSYSISGMTYQAIPRGPVPLRYDGLYGNVSDIVERKDEYFTNDVSGERFVGKKEFDATNFTQEELNTLEKVVDRFKNTPTKDIELISHDEPAWFENKDTRNIISYQFAFELKALN
jgi:transcriptional regulator with XRE-family HTH domain